jgi:hypothetical protein
MLKGGGIYSNHCALKGTDAVERTLITRRDSSCLLAHNCIYFMALFWRVCGTEIGRLLSYRQPDMAPSVLVRRNVKCAVKSWFLPCLLLKTIEVKITYLR